MGFCGSSGNDIFLSLIYMISKYDVKISTSYDIYIYMYNHLYDYVII